MKKFQRGITLVPVVINGISINVNPASIGREKRTLLHGTYKGIKVNSPEYILVGETAIVWPEAGKAPAFSMSKAALGVLATQFLQSEGDIVTTKS